MDVILCLAVQKPKNGKPVSDQWVPAFVITDEKDQPDGSIQVLLWSRNDPPPFTPMIVAGETCSHAQQLHCINRLSNTAP